MEENPKYLTEQIITYIGNKRSLLNEISTQVEECLRKLGKEKAVTADLFSGSGIVARMLKKYSSAMHVNDLEDYSYIINDCYLTNKEDFNEVLYEEYKARIEQADLFTHGNIYRNYAPVDDKDIKEGERVFYTTENAILIDTYRNAINGIPAEYRKFFIAPLLYEASVHTNTSGVFKGFYKSKATGIGKLGGDGENAMERITGKITLRKPVLSNFSCDTNIYKADANYIATTLKDIDITYLDPPYNQHPYGSNYFMLNVIANNDSGYNMSKVSGIPVEWNRSSYNKKSMALNSLRNLIWSIDSKYIITSYNNEGFISLDEMCEMMSIFGNVSYKPIEYVSFRGGRQSKDRSTHTTEYLFTLEKS